MMPMITNESFLPFERAMEGVSARYPGAPYQEILLTRLYYHLLPRMGDYFNARLQQFGINETQFLAIMSLFAFGEGAANPSDLSNCLDSSRTNITRVADELVKHGWVERHHCAEDRRKLNLKLTPAGFALAESMLPEMRAAQRELWQDFSADEKNLLEGLLRKLLARLGG